MHHTEIVFKIIEIIMAVIGLVLVIIGWIIPYRHSIKTEKLHIYNEKELERIRRKKDLIDKQIAKLYGPIYSLIIQGDVSYSRILYQLG